MCDWNFSHTLKFEKFQFEKNFIHTLKFFTLVLEIFQQQAKPVSADSAKALSNGAPADAELETLRCQLQDLQLVLQKKDESLYKLQQQSAGPAEANAQMQQQLAEVQAKLQASEALNRQLQEQSGPGSGGALAEERKRREQLQSELAALQSEQEDLLLLLAEQDGRLQRYQSHLTVRGVTPPPGEEAGEEEEEEDLQ